MTTTTEQHSPVFLTIGEQIQTFPLKFPYETHGVRVAIGAEAQPRATLAF